MEIIDTNQEDLNESDSFAIIDHEPNTTSADVRALELELLSNIDPEDEFLRSTKSYSLIESVSLNESSF
jgi:hypothetical protein